VLRVTDAETGRPVEGVTVTAWPADRPLPVDNTPDLLNVLRDESDGAVGVTDEKGEVELELDSALPCAGEDCEDDEFLDQITGVEFLIGLETPSDADVMTLEMTPFNSKTGDRFTVTVLSIATPDRILPFV
jgi:hypothetical protein